MAVQLHDRHGLPAVDAHVRATLTGRVLVRDQVAGGSYLSAFDPVLYFGLGSEARLDRLDVEWPWGSVETWRNLAAGRLHRLDAGKAASSPSLKALSR
jgi:enediyne biosynthesis protein E4